MSRNIREDISVKMEYLNIALISSGLRVVVIGGGSAALIKIKTLLKAKVELLVVAKEIKREILDIKDNNLTIIKEAYKKEYIEDKHLVFICIDKGEMLDNIVLDCESLNKIYLNASKASEGRFVTKKTLETREFTLSINSKRGNPKGTLYIGEKIKKEVEKYDSFIEYTSSIREKIKMTEMGKEILDFINTDNFKDIFDRGKARIVLKLFYGDIF